MASKINIKNFMYLFNSFCLSYMNSTFLLYIILLGGSSGRLSDTLKSKSYNNLLCILSNSEYLFLRIHICDYRRTSIKYCYIKSILKI